MHAKSQRVMLRPSTDSKYLGLIQIVLCQTKNIVTNCGGYRQKDDFRLYLVNSKCFSGLAQKNWTGTKHFGTCRRTRHKCKTMCDLDLELTLCTVFP